MPSSRLHCRIAGAVAICVAAACLSLPALADAPTAVTFQDHNPWTQEIGSVDHYDDSHDYTVQVAASKTLQINLVTRDPNVFFKVKNETTGDQLVDTYKTGATTWSTPNATAATYRIHVYVDPAAMQRGETAKYALQVGQYGAEDMQAATTEVTFKDDNPWAQEVGRLDSNGTAHDYTVAIAAGNTLQVNLVTRNTNLHFKVKDPTGATELVDTGKTGASTWSTPVATPTTYTISVYVDAAAMPPGKSAEYALQVGQYPSADAQPAATTSAGSAVAAAASAAAPASAASAAMPAPAATTGH